MNISNLKIKQRLLYCLLLFLPIGLQGQIQYFEVLADTQHEYSFESFPGTANVLQSPDNGSYLFNGELNAPFNGLSGTNTLIYLPDPGFLGNDTVKVSYWLNTPPVISSTTMTIIYEVIPAFITANNDYVSTDPGQAVNIDVLFNDDYSGSNIEISNLPISNHGEATINPNGTVDFTPAAGFTGTAQFNYTICDLNNAICDVAMVTVFVQDNSTQIDTTTLVTLKNQSIKALIPLENGYQEVLAPANGSLVIVDGGVEYTPNTDFVGLDTFTYAYNLNTNTSIATFVIDVLWAEDPNTFVVDDYGFTTIDQSTSVNVLNNDLNDNLSILSYSQSNTGGLVVHDGSGNFSYTPAANYEGLDFFTYTAGVTGSPGEETGRVYIVVSNQMPSAQTFSLTTPVNTPLVINYNIPISNFDFAITSSGNNGTAEFYQGDFQDYGITLNGQSLTGYNLVVYSPEEDFTGADEFEMNYCVGTDCQLVKIELEVIEVESPQQDTLCVGDCVWSGDANYDGKVDMNDLLPVGYCVGEVGFERPNGVVEWYGQYGENWDQNIGNTPVDVKHVDTDGDGFIEAEDTLALSTFYGLYHNITPEDNLTQNNIPLFFVPKNPNPAPGDMVQVDVVLGTNNFPAIDIHGLTFALNFNPSIVEPGTMNVKFTNSNWMAYNSTMLGMVKEPYIGRVEAGYTRTSGVSANGYGIIATVEFVIVEDNIDGLRLRDTLLQPFRVDTPSMMNSAGMYAEIFGEGFDLRIAREIPTDLELSEKQLIVYPNPTDEALNIHLNGDNQIEELTIMTITGQEIFRSGTINDNQFSMNLGTNYANGIYVIQAVTEKGIINKKFEVLR